MNELKYRFYLNACNVFPLEKQVYLIQKYKQAKTIFEDLKLAQNDVSSKEHEALLKNSSRLEENNNFERLINEGVSFILSEDENYPKSLSYIKNPPHLLYVKGSTDLNYPLGISVIGTRKVNMYGRSQAQHFASHLANSGIHIISGLAKGIDSIAMKEAIQNHGKVIGVLGTGIDLVYPKENEKLFREVESNGSIISEFSPGTKPFGHNFPYRNRIISGLCNGLLVVQASIKSGTSGTVKWALEQGKDIFAIPGPVNCEVSKGPNKMIQEGAMLAQSPLDIIEFYQGAGHFESTRTSIENFSRPIAEKKNDTPTIPDYLQEMGLDHSAKDIEEIIDISGLEYTTLTRKLNLEVAKGAVEKVPGGRYKIKST